MNKKSTKYIVITLFITLAVVGSLFGFNKFKESYIKKVSYSTFMTQLEGHKIEKAKIEKDSKVIYSLKGSKKKYYTAYPDSENFKEKMLKNGVEIEVDSPFKIEYLINIVSIGTSVGVILLLFNMLMPSNKFEVVDSKKIKTKFSDVAGHDELKKELLLISEMMKNQKYRDRGAKVPKGILLQGPPGNGKTLISRAFAGETGVNFIAATASDFSSQFVGIGSNKVKQLFKLAKANTPCVIFIDEIDGVGSKRMDETQAADKEMNTILTTLLNEMDGFSENEDIMVLAATNRSGALDEALIRPGRFDRQFIVSYPDKNDRIELLKLYTKNTNTDNIDFGKIANRTHGSSASEIECICNEAILNSVTNKHENVTEEDFNEAILKTAIKGNIKHNYIRNDKERKIIAYHEAGHAVMSFYNSQREVTTITIKPTTSGAGGFTMTEESENKELKTLSDLYGHLKMLYGGRASEYVLNGCDIMKITTGASADIQQATKMVSDYICAHDGVDLSAYGSYGIKEIMDRSTNILNEIWMETVKDVQTHWIDVKKIADRLIEKETISKEEFYSIMNKEKIDEKIAA